MQVKKLVLLSSLGLIFSIGLSASSIKYSNEEIYTKMCSKCHGLNAKGNSNKNAPALNDLSVHELEITLFDLKSEGLNQSSGSEHELMAHNMRKILDKGLNYEPKSMASYIFSSFNPEAKYYKRSKKENNFTVSEIYGKMCSKCHGLNAQGNTKKKGPALNDKTAHELESELIEIRDGGLNQSSGNNHEVMVHNQKRIEKRGMKYEPKEMAEYITSHFNNK